MEIIRPKTLVLIFACALFAWAHAAYSAERLDFVAIHPGQPGSPDEAKPILEALAAYLQKKVGDDCAMSGRYFNRLDAALDYMSKTPPAWGIVSLGFYMENAKRFRMTPIASSRPAGLKSDRLRLVTPRDAPADWQKLTGVISGTVCFEKTAVSCLLFGRAPEKLPFSLEGTFYPLRSVRAAADGQATGVVLDRRQYEAMQALQLTQKLKVLLDSKDLPTSPVVWFGSPAKGTDRLANALLGMREDPGAKDLLVALQTKGFAPPDPQLDTLKMPKNGTCPP